MAAMAIKAPKPAEVEAKVEWESISRTTLQYGLWRTRVDGGWLYVYDSVNRAGMAFVPDKEPAPR